MQTIEFKAEIQRGEDTRIITVSASANDWGIIVSYSPKIPLTQQEYNHIVESAKSRMGWE